MDTYNYILESGFKVQVMVDPTFNRVTTRQLIITAPDDDSLGITTSVIRSLTSSIIRPNSRQELSYDVALNTPPPSPNWHLKRRHSNVTIAELEAIANVYNQALSSGFSPTKFVQIWLRMSKPTASRYVKRARQAGLIGIPIKRGLAAVL